MEEKKQKNDEKNSLLDWYNEIPRKKRSKFILALQLKFGMSASGIYDKIKKTTGCHTKKILSMKLSTKEHGKNCNKMQS